MRCEVAIVVPFGVPKLKRRQRPPSGGNGDYALGAGTERLHLGGEAALVPGGLVPVDDALACDAIERRSLGAQRRFGTGRVAPFDRLLHLLDRRAERRAQAHVRTAALVRLLRALGGLLGIGPFGI